MRLFEIKTTAAIVKTREFRESAKPGWAVHAEFRPERKSRVRIKQGDEIACRVFCGGHNAKALGAFPPGNLRA